MAFQTTTVLQITVVTNGPKFNPNKVFAGGASDVTVDKVISTSVEEIKKVRTLDEDVSSISAKMIKKELLNRYEFDVGNIKVCGDDRYITCYFYAGHKRLSSPSHMFTLSAWFDSAKCKINVKECPMAGSWRDTKEVPVYDDVFRNSEDIIASIDAYLNKINISGDDVFYGKGTTPEHAVSSLIRK